MLLQRMILQRGLRPLDDTRQDILRLAQGEIRQLNTNIPTEIKPLVGEINRLVHVMTQRLQRSRRALGNLAHALKTPLTILLQLAEHPKVKHQDALCGELGRQTRRIRLLIDRELKRARIAGAAAPGQRVILENEIRDLVDTLKKIYRDKDLGIQCQIPAGSFFTGDRDDLLELLGNLLDNACQWAAHRIRLTVANNAEGLNLRVEDDGPGCPPERLDLLTQRGVRIDESYGGHGLGLAIVADILEHYEGCLHLGRSPDLGGFLAQVEIPNLNAGYGLNHRN
jgi:signal transduction histidine kinase